MSVLRALKLLGLAGALALAVPVVMAQSSQDIPLGDVVKQKKSGRKAKRVITNDDIPSRAPEPAAGSTGTANLDSSAASQGQQSARASKPIPESVKKEIENLKAREEVQRQLIDRFSQGLEEEGISEQRRELYNFSLNKARQNLANLAQQRMALEAQAASGVAPRPTEGQASSASAEPGTEPEQKPSEQAATEEQPPST